MSYDKFRPVEQTFNGLLKVSVSSIENVFNYETGYVSSPVTLTNVGQVPLKSVSVVIDPDDNGKLWDVTLVTSSGTPIQGNQTLAVGDLSVGQSKTVTFWYSISPILSSARPKEDFLVTLNVVPLFSVDYSGYGYVANTTTFHTK